MTARAKWIFYLVSIIAYGICFGSVWNNFVQPQLVNLPTVNTVLFGVGLYVPMLVLAAISIRYYNAWREERRQRSK